MLSISPTGEGGNNFGLSADENGNPLNGPKGVFIGGRVLGADTAWAIAQGQRLRSILRNTL